VSRGRPQLLLLLPLEGRAQPLLITDTLEDERRLRQWLRAHELAELTQAVVELLDALDRFDKPEAA
jgi:hypothetical protein